MFTYYFEQNISITISRLILTVFIAILPLFGGCGEDNHDHDTDEVIHADADGVVLMVDDVEVYRQFEDSQTGGITLSVNDEVEVEVVFLDHEEEEVDLDALAGKEDDHEEHDDEEVFNLAISEYDEEIIDIHLSDEEGEDDHDEDEDEDDDHDEDSHLSFEVVGLKSGETTIKLQLMHGEHPDFTALPIPVTVQ